MYVKRTESSTLVDAVYREESETNETNKQDELYKN